MTQQERDQLWPALPFADWKDTCVTLHMWTQIVGKVRLALTPWLNHSWHVTLYVTARGLTTSPIAHHMNVFEIDFDFIDHLLIIRSSTSAERTIALRAMAVADFYNELMSTLAELGFEAKISGAPNEVEDATPFSQDTKHASYDRDAANRFWRVLLQSDRVFKQFRAPFVGKCSPVHFFWGSFDLAVTRFSGRTAPPHPGGYRICQMQSLAKPIRTRSAVLDFGRGVKPVRRRVSIRTRIPRRMASRECRSNLRQRSGTQQCVNGCSRMKQCALPNRQKKR